MNKNNIKTEFAILSILLGVAAIASTAAYFIYKILRDRAYKEKWHEYDDCGLA